MHIPGTADRYSVLIMGNLAGQQVIWTAPDGSLHIFSQYNDRARGPKTTSTLKLDARGIPVVETVDGNDYLKSPVQESYWLDSEGPYICDRPWIVGAHETLGRKNCDQRSRFHQCAARRESQCFSQVMSDKDYGLTQLLLQGEEFMLEFGACKWIERDASPSTLLCCLATRR